MEIAGCSPATSRARDGAAACGLRIRPALPVSQNSVTGQGGYLLSADQDLRAQQEEKHRAATERASAEGGTRHRSVVRAVRRAPRDISGHSSARKLQLNEASSSSECWLPFTALQSLCWSFVEAPAAEAEAASLRYSVGGGADPHARSSTLCGVSEGRSRVEVRLSCASGSAGSCTAAGSPLCGVETVVLQEVSCAEALALADAFDEMKRKLRAANTIAAGVGGSRHTGQESHSVLPPPSRAANLDAAAYADPTTSLSTRHTRSPPISSYTQNDVVAKPPRAISFTNEMEELPPRPPSPQWPKQGERQSPLTPTAAESRSYAKYARMLGMETQQPSRRSSPAALSVVPRVASSSSFNDSFGSAMTSDVHTPMGGALHFPRRGSAVLCALAPDEDDDGPLSEPAGLSRQHRGRCSVGTAKEQRSDADEDVSSAGRAHNGDARLTLPSVVETSSAATTTTGAADGPAWFPAAPLICDVSEATASSADSSLNRLDGTTLPGEVTAVRPSNVSPLTAVAPLHHAYELDDPALGRWAVRPVSENEHEEGKRITGAHAPPRSPRGTPTTTIVFPPRPSAPLSPPPPRTTAVETDRCAPAFRYLTAEQRQLIDFDQLLRPTLPPSSGARGPSAASPSGSTPLGISLSPTFTTVPDSAAAATTMALRPPAALDEILLKLRASALPVTVTNRSSPLAARGATVPVRTAAATQRSTAEPSRPPAAATTDTPARAAAAVVVTSGRALPESSTSSSSPLPSASVSNLVLSYREVLQQMRNRQVTPAPTPAAATTTAAPPPPAALLPSVLSPTQLQAIRSVALGAPVALTPTAAAADTTGAPTSPLARGDAVPHRTHGPFALPAQHPPGFFLAHGDSRGPASPLSSPPHRVRRLPPGKLLQSQSPSTVQTNHRSGGRENGTVTTPLNPSQSPLSRSGRDMRSPQSPPQMLPRRPDPLIGTPKLALEQPASIDVALLPPPPPPMLLGQSLVDEEGNKSSSTSMAT